MINHISNDPVHFAKLDVLIFFIALLLTCLYIGFAIVSNSYRHLRKWPFHRYLCFALGAFCVAISCVGPLAHLAHSNFAIHMIVHLLLGMLGPLLIVLAAPLTLLLRTIHVKAARRFVKLLHRPPFSLVAHPAIASILNIGGLWLLYRSNLFYIMQQNSLLHWLIHLHIFLAGYVFTVSLIYIDPAPQHYSFRYRAIVFLLATAAHNLLAKYIYLAPPLGVEQGEAKLGGLLMYYGGDVIDAIIVFIFCWQWYQQTNPYKVKMGMKTL